MKTLLIDNHTKHLKELVSLFPNVTIVEKENLFGIDVSQYDLLVISGGSNVPTVLRHPEMYAEEIEIVKAAKIPVIGICLGAEIVTVAFGGELRLLSADHRGSVHLQIRNPLLEKVVGKNIVVMEGHAIGIKTIPADFIVYAESEHGVEMMKHVKKPIFAFQFHPEVSPQKPIVDWLLGKS